MVVHYGNKLKKKENRNFYFFISPWLIGLTLFTLIPLALSLYFSFTDVVMSSALDGVHEIIGFANYQRIFTKDADFITSIGNTFVYTIFKVLFSLILALIFALLFNSSIFGKKIDRVLVYLPAIIPTVSVALLWQMLFTGGTANVINYLITSIGFKAVDFFGSNTQAMSTTIFVGVWSGIGPSMLILLAALQNVPVELQEAAELDGAGPITKFFNITLPMISSSIYFIALTGVIGGLQAYAEIKLLTNGGPGIATKTMNMFIIDNAFNTLGNKTLGYASAQGWVVFAITLVFTIIYLKLSSKKVYYE